MSWSGSGSFNRAHKWTDDAAAGIPITASRMDAEDDNFATGINACLAKNGENAATGNLNIGGYRLTSVGAGSAATDAATIGGTETLTNKTIESPVINGPITGNYTLSFTVTEFIKNLLAAADLATAQSVLEIQTLIDAAKRVTFAGILNSSLPSDATKYFHPNGNTADVYTSPNVVAAPSPTDFTLTSLRTRLATNTFDGALTLTVMVNGVATAATVTYTAGETGAKSWSGSVAISAGDAIEVRFAESATTGNISQLVWAMS